MARPDVSAAPARDTGLVLEDVLPPPSTESIAALTHTLSGPIPACLLALWARANGAATSEDVCRSTGVHGLVPVGQGSLPAEQLHRELTAMADTFARLLPIAFDQGGNLFLVDCGARRYGQVVLAFFDHGEVPVIESLDLDVEVFVQRLEDDGACTVRDRSDEAPT